MKPFVWYMPTWNGDLRLSEIKANLCELAVIKPTATEQVATYRILDECRTRGWFSEKVPELTGKSKLRFKIAASMRDLGPIASSILRPGSAVMSAIVFSNGQVEVSSKAEGPTLEELSRVLSTPYRSPAEIDKPEPKAVEKTKPEPVAAATVKRPTPCCPQCMPGAIEPATEALLAFLTPDQHEQWAKTRTIEVIGGLSGTRYLLAHRHTEVARRRLHRRRSGFGIQSTVWASANAGPDTKGRNLTSLWCLVQG